MSLVVSTPYQLSRLRMSIGINSREICNRIDRMDGIAHVTANDEVSLGYRAVSRSDQSAYIIDSARRLRSDLDELCRILVRPCGVDCRSRGA